MKTVSIVALLLTSILLLGTIEVATAECPGDLVTYRTYFVNSVADKGTECATICFDDGIAMVVNIGCDSMPSGILAAEVGDDGDFGKSKQNYVGKLGDFACHLYVWNFKGSYFTLDCLQVDDNGYSFHVFGELSDCTCGTG